MANSGGTWGWGSIERGLGGEAMIKGLFRA